MPQVAQGGYDCKDKVEILPSQPEVRGKKFADNLCLEEIGVWSSAQQSTGLDSQDGQPVGKSETGRRGLEQAKGYGLSSIQKLLTATLQFRSTSCLGPFQTSCTSTAWLHNFSTLSVDQAANAARSLVSVSHPLIFGTQTGAQSTLSLRLEH